MVLMLKNTGTGNVNYLYDLFYRGRGYERKRPIKKDGRRRSHRRPKVELEFTKTWKDYQKNS